MIPKVALDAMHEGHFLPLLFDALSHYPLPCCALYGPADYWQSWYHSLPSGIQEIFLPYHQPLKKPVSLEQLWHRGYRFILSTQTDTLLPEVWADKEGFCCLWHYDGEHLWITAAIWPLELLNLEQWLQLYRLAQYLKEVVFSSLLAPMMLGPIVSGSAAEQQFQALVPVVRKERPSAASVLLIEPLLYQQQLSLLSEKSRPQTVKKWWGSEKKQDIWCAQGVCSAKSLLVVSKPQSQKELRDLFHWAHLSCRRTSPR